MAAKLDQSKKTGLILNKKYDLTGKTALITGASGLLGGQHARAILQHGGAVVLTDISEPGLKKLKIELEKEFRPDMVSFFFMDVTDESSIKLVSKELHEKGVFISILINNAAVDPKVGARDSLTEISRLENFSSRQWDFEIAVGLTGVFLCSKIFGTAMAESKSPGVILNISSDLSIISPDQRLYAKEHLDPMHQPVKPITYSAIKAGVVGLTRYLATYWSEQNVRCNSLSPGGVENGQGDDFTRQLTSRIPMGRMANVDEYQGVIQFLCSDASEYMTGQNIVIDGGRSVW